jgi:serine/threonine protein kinase
VKPANVFLTTAEDGFLQVRVLDFGIVQISADNDLTQTHLTDFGGAPMTVAYASPEQRRRATPLTQASDVFSLGVIAYELLTGKGPYEGYDFSRALPGEHTGEFIPSPPSVSEHRSNLPSGVDAIIRRALEYDPAKRYPDATALGDALTVVLDHPPAAAPTSTQSRIEKAAALLESMGYQMKRHRKQLSFESPSRPTFVVEDRQFYLWFSTLPTRSGVGKAWGSDEAFAQCLSDLNEINRSAGVARFFCTRMFILAEAKYTGTGDEESLRWFLVSWDSDLDALSPYPKTRDTGP